MCWAADERAARRLAREVWPNAALASSLSWELPLPSHFEDAAEMLTEDAIAESVVCGPDPRRHIQAIEHYADAGYDHVCIHQVGPDQQRFMQFYRAEVLPEVKLRRKAAA